MSLDNFIAKFPPGLVAFVVITVGIIGIIAYDPPKTVCDAEEEIFRNNHRHFLAPNPKSTQGLSKFDEQKEICKQSNSPGGCYEFFSQVRNLIASVEGTSKECRNQIGEIGLVKNAFWQTATLFVHLAWGAKPPENVYEKVGWLDYSDINLFCRLQGKINEIYGLDSWQNFQTQMLATLPGITTLPREQAWNLMLLSVRCNQYQ
jgi:hypothetical protein